MLTDRILLLQRSSLHFCCFKHRGDEPRGLIMWGLSIGEAAVVLPHWKNFALPTFSFTTHYYETFVPHPYYPREIFSLSFQSNRCASVCEHAPVSMSVFKHFAALTNLTLLNQSSMNVSWVVMFAFKVLKSVR